MAYSLSSGSFCNTQICHTVAFFTPNLTSKSLFHNKCPQPQWDLQQKKHRRIHSRHPIHSPTQINFLNGTLRVHCRVQSKANAKEKNVNLENAIPYNLLFLKSLVIPVATSFVVFSLALGARVAVASTLNRRLVPPFANVSSVASSSSSTEKKTVQKLGNGTASAAEEKPISKDSGANSIDAESPPKHSEKIQVNHPNYDVKQKADTPSGNQIGVMSEQLNSAKDGELQKAYERWRSKPYALTVPLRIAALRGSVPPAWLKDFVRAQGRRLKLQVESSGSLGGIISELSKALEKRHMTPKSVVAADLVTIGDSWLELAISNGLIEPIKNAEQEDWFIHLSDRWKAYLRRDRKGQIDPKGEIWGVPYRWGCMVVAYRKDKFEKYNIPPIKDWEDLWRPQLMGKLSMVDAPREVVGAILKCLEASYNSRSFESDIVDGRNSVRALFLLLQRQVRLFDSVHYVKAFGSGDVWVTVGWSSDVLQVVKGMRNVAVVVPESGTSLWADLWSIPAASSIDSDKIGGRIRGPSPLTHQWFDFCLQPARVTPFYQGVFPGASPLFLRDNTFFIKSEDDTVLNESANGMQTPQIRKGGPQFDTNLVAGMPPPDILQKCEFLEPLTEKARLDYEWLLSKAAKREDWPSSFWQYLKGLRETLKVALLRGVR